jgi:hypothetical protein
MLAFSKPIKSTGSVSDTTSLATASKRVDGTLCQVFRRHWPSARQLFALIGVRHKFYKFSGTKSTPSPRGRETAAPRADCQFVSEKLQ